MTNDDQLRDALRAEAEAIEPSAQGYPQIKARIARRRRIVLWQRSTLAAATALSLVAVAVVYLDNRGDNVAVTDPSPSASEPPPEPTDSPSPSPSASAVPASTRIEAVWPFATQSGVGNWGVESEPALLTPETAVEAFRAAFLGSGAWSRGAKRLVEPRVVEIDLLRSQEQGAKPIVVTTVTLRSYGRVESDGPWLVMHALNPNLDVNEPSVPTSITTPAQVSGTIVGYHHSIQTQVNALDGQSLGSAYTEAGQDMPWRTSVSFKRPASVNAGSVTAMTRSDGDGGITWFVAVPVTLAEVTDIPAMPTNFVAVKDQRLALFRASDGAITRYLTTAQPGGGASSPTMSPDRKTVFFIRGAGTCAASISFVPVGGGPEQVKYTFRDAVPSDLAISPDGMTLAYVRTACPDGSTSLAVRRMDGEHQEQLWRLGTGGVPGGLAFENSFRRLYFVRSRQIYSIDTSDPRSVPQPTSATVVDAITWSPHYAAIVGVQHHDTHHRFMTIRANGVSELLFDIPDVPVDQFVDGVDADIDGPNLIFATVSGDTRGPTSRWTDGHLIRLGTNLVSPTW